MTKCIYCDLPAFNANGADPLCQKHLELRAIAFVLERQGKQVTAETVKSYLDLISDATAVQPKEVKGLLRQMKSTLAGRKTNKP